MGLQSNVYKRNNSWVFHISDFNWELDEFATPEIHSNCVEWTEHQLASQPRVKRMAYDMWYFERKRDAEKFQTFWLLKFSA